MKEEKQSSIKYWRKYYQNNREEVDKIIARAVPRDFKRELKQYSRLNKGQNN